MASERSLVWRMMSASSTWRFLASVMNPALSEWAA